LAGIDDNAQPIAEEFFMEAVEEGLSLLGKSGKEAVFFYLEKGYNVKKNQIASKPKHFSDALDNIFGLGAIFLKTIILRGYYEKIGLTPPDKLENIDFAECVINSMGGMP
jgi:hypothetical protein